MRVYIAGPYAARDHLRSLVPDLTAEKMFCTSTWLGETRAIDDGTTGAATELTDEQVKRHAQQDLADLRRSQGVVAFTAAGAGVARGGHTGGRHVETGYALALGLPIVVVGEPEHVFHRLGDFGRNRVVLAADWPAAVKELVALRERTGPRKAVR